MTPQPVTYPPQARLPLLGGEPSRLQAALFIATLLLLCIFASGLTGGYTRAVLANGDNAAYARVAHAIRTWDLRSVPVVKHVWGLPYCAAALSAILRISELHAIAAVSLISAIACVFLAGKLWSGWVALYFAAVNYTFIQFAAYGGSEPLFVLLVLASFWFTRDERWAASSLAAALSATVRPLGVFALGLCTRPFKDAKRIVVIVGVAALVGCAYLAPQIIYLGNPFLHWKTYQQQDWRGQLPITIPLLAVWQNLRSHSNVGNSVMTVVKLAYVLVHIAALGGICFSRRRRDRLFAHLEEGMTVVLYSAFVLVYNAPTWSLSIYPRLLIPVTPMLLDAYSDLLPRNWVAPAVAGLAAAALAIGANLGFAGIRSLLAI